MRTKRERSNSHAQMPWGQVKNPILNLRDKAPGKMIHDHTRTRNSISSQSERFRGSSLLLLSAPHFSEVFAAAGDRQPFQRLPETNRWNGSQTNERRV